MALLFSSFSVTAQEQLIDRVLAVVGNEIILNSDVKVQLDQRKAAGEEFGENGACLVLEDLMFEKLLIHQAEVDSVEVTDAEVQAVLDRRMDYFISQLGSRKKLEEYYGKTVAELEEELYKPIYGQLVAQKMQQEITGDLKVTPQEVRQFFMSIPSDSLPFINSQVEINQLVKYPEITPESRQQALDRINELRQRVMDGSKVSTLAVLYSEDPGSSKNGGKYEGIKRGQFVKEFEAVAFTMKPGEISEVFETEYGFHFMELLAKRGQEIDLRHILISPKVTDDALQEANRFLDSIKVAIEKGDISFDKAAKEFSDDKATKYNGGAMINPANGETKFEINELDKGLFFTIDNLEEGEISEPLYMNRPDGKPAFRLIQLKKQTPPHRANMKDDYQRIKEVALSQKRTEVLEAWIAEHVATTYIRVNESFDNCELKKWRK